MKVSVILAHPDKGSFNHAIAGAAVRVLKTNGHEVAFHDLYKEKFPPVLAAQEIPRGAPLPRVISQHCSEISNADGIIVIHPNWWGQPPAILKGWVDRVLRPGVAYTFAEGDSGDGELIGLLKAKAVLVFNTSNTPTEREMTLYGDPLENLWKNNMFISCGAKSFHRKTFGVIVTSSLEQRSTWLREVEQTTDRLFPGAFASEDRAIIRELSGPLELRESARVIRAAFKTVADEFDLNRQNCPAHTAFMTTDSLREQWSNGLKCFGLFEGLRQVGFVGIEAYDPHGAPVLFRPGEAWYWLEKLAVLPSCRHGGYGERLISFAIDYIRQAGGTRVGLGMMNEHNVLKDWYLGLGFKEVELKTFPGLPFTVCFMERDCSPV